MNVTSILHLHEIGGKKNQEDYLWPEAGAATVKDRVFIVCDGVGGSENGEVAARVISSEVGKALESADAKPMSEEYLAELIGKAKESLMFHATRDVLGYEMATTFSMLYLEDSRAFMGWCGDSRVYHVRNGKVLYKTEDHSLVNSLVKSGEITEEEALTHPRRNIILKAIKADYEPVEVEGHWIEDI
ncbi:MAG: serine/threonine-protein phosphatase, partial [Gemmatimonadaceae bacterium]|nr:serine/threonine-protein phosphatase [Chitinophagaceae bacterium]